jgi:hypothetical protein
MHGQERYIIESFLKKRLRILGYLPSWSGTHMVSQDGKFPLTTTTAKETKENVLAILQSKSKGYEENIRTLLELRDGKWVNVGYDADWTLKSLPYNLIRAYGDAFKEYLG